MFLSAGVDHCKENLGMPSPDPIPAKEQADIITSLSALQAEVAELKKAIFLLIPAQSQISIVEKARIIREAHLSGSRSAILKANKAINRRS